MPQATRYAVMEKAMGFANGSTQPSAPPPSAPPSYEEAVENAVRVSRQPNIPPYPVGPSSMPIPTNAQSTSQTAPLPPNYPGLSKPLVQSQAPPQAPHCAYTNAVPPPEVRVVYQTVVYSLGPKPAKTVCPTCHASIKTTTISDHQRSAHFWCIVLCFLGCCLCSCLPYCMSSFRNVHHFCPKCKDYIGTWKG